MVYFVHATKVHLTVGVVVINFSVTLTFIVEEKMTVLYDHLNNNTVFQTNVWMSQNIGIFPSTVNMHLNLMNYVHLHVCVYADVYFCVHLYAYGYMYVCMYVCVCINSPFPSNHPLPHLSISPFCSSPFFPFPNYRNFLGFAVKGFHTEYGTFNGTSKRQCFL